MDTDISRHVKKLSELNSSIYPVVSLYLNTQANDRGRDQFLPWVRKELSERKRTFNGASEAAKSFERDCERIETWLTNEVDAASNAVAIFACAAEDDFFDAIQFSAPIKQNELHVQGQPHLYPLARLLDQYPRYAAVIADTNSARIVVFGLNRVEKESEVQNVKTNRSEAGGWSQARFQRHIDNFHKQHAKEVIEKLDQIVRAEDITQFVLVGDQEVVIPLLEAEMPKALSEMMVDALRLDSREGNNTLLARSMEALRADDAVRDTDKVAYLIGEYRAGGLATAGVIDTLTALENGQVEELVIAADYSSLETPEEALALASDIAIAENKDTAALIANLLVTKAEQTAARLTFVENPDLLRNIGGCGAILRFRMDNTMPKKGNYNHDYYKIRGKEPGNQDVMAEKNIKEVAEQTKPARKRATNRKANASNPISPKKG